ncbi:MAG: MFS transporter [Anaerolineae bacterium]|jgi:predicted MFS family arabinose efflux permease
MVSRLAKTTLFALFWANFFNFFDRQVIAALAPILQAYWGLSDTQLGLLATAFEVSYALAPVPIALLADRWLRRRVVALSVALWSGAMALTGAAGSFAVLLLGRAGLGVGEAGYGPSALAWLSDLWPPSHRSRAVGIHDLALMVGSAAGYALGGVLGLALGWRPVFFLAAVPGFLLAIVLWFMPEPPKGQSDYEALGLAGPSRADQGLSFRAAARELLSIPSLVVTYTVTVLINLATAGIIYWLPTFAVRLHGLGEDQAGLLIGAMTVVTGGAGVLAGGWVADRVLQRTPAGRLLVISGSYALGFPLALAAVAVTDTVPFAILATVAVFLFSFYFPCLAPLIHQVTRPELRATAMALYLLVAHILGNALAPALIGWFSDQAGNLRLGIGVALGVALIGALIGLWGSRFVGPDTRAMLDKLGTER